MYETPLPGWSIPHHFTVEEKADFLAQHGNDPYVQNYLRTREPVWGIKVTEPYGEIMLYFAADGELHIVDITNLAISESFDKAPYESPDSSFWSNFQVQLNDLLADTTTGILLGAVVMGALLVWKASKK